MLKYKHLCCVHASLLFSLFVQLFKYHQHHPATLIPGLRVASIPGFLICWADILTRLMSTLSKHQPFDFCSFIFGIIYLYEYEEGGKGGRQTNVFFILLVRVLLNYPIRIQYSSRVLIVPLNLEQQSETGYFSFGHFCQHHHLKFPVHWRSHMKGDKKKMGM